MSKQVMIGLFALSLVVLVWTDADAGCCCNPRICASWISGSGYSTGLVTQDVQKDAPESIACEVVTFTGFVDKCQPATDPNCQSKVSLTLRLLGTDGTNCGFGDQKTESCGIKGFAVCGTSTNKKVIIPGPLNVCSPGGVVQSDGSSKSANFRFQIDDSSQQSALCGSDTFQAFVAQEGYFEARVTVVDSQGTTNTYCNRQFCTVDSGGISRDVPRVYNCKQLAEPAQCEVN